MSLGGNLFGSKEVKSYYDTKGWVKNSSGIFHDRFLYGSKYSGKLSKNQEILRTKRIKMLIGSDKLDFLEVGCGAKPAAFSFDLCSKYTGVDFSKTGLFEADKILSEQELPFNLVYANACNLPFLDNEFDVCYSAHMIYHIPSKNGQEKAFDEMMRVVKKDGKALFVVGNPRPFLFPITFIVRLISDSKIWRTLRDKLGRKVELAYYPQTIGWMEKKLERKGKVKIVGYALAPNNIQRNISEDFFFGKLYWRFLFWLELNFPKLSAYLGNYVLIAVTKK